MKRIAIALSGLAFVFGAAAAVLQPSARADEPQVEEAYKPTQEQPEAKDVRAPAGEEKTAADIDRQKKAKAKSRQLRRGNHP